MAYRDLGTVAWKDDLVKLENMTSSSWNNYLKDEKANYNKSLNDPNVQARIPAFKASLEKAKKALSQISWFNLYYRKTNHYEPIRAIVLAPNGNLGAIRWCYHNGPRTMHSAEDIDIDYDFFDSLIDVRVFTIIDAGNGSEDYKLTCQSIRNGEIWIKKGVGPNVVVSGSRVYYLRHKKRLWYYQVCSCDKITGNDEHVELEMTDVKYNLSIIKVPNTFMVKADNNGYSMLYVMNGNMRLQRIDTDAIWHIPNSFVFPNISRFVLKQNGEWEHRISTYYKDPKEYESEIINEHFIEEYGEPYFFDFPTNVVLTKKNGIAYALRLRGNWNKTPIRLLVVPGGILTPDIFSRSTDDYYTELRVLVQDPCKAPYLIHFGNTNDKIMLRSPYVGNDNNEFNRISVKSNDGTIVHAAYIKQKRTHIKALLTVIYGAYGIPTSIGHIMQKWGPLLESGWAIGFAFVRGGGDNGWDWAEAGRRDQRYKALEDAEACIRGLQRKLHLPATRTMIYGRSAGGIQVGALANRNLLGQLFIGIYCEVPYLDVLQTTTNPALPLTELEYDEFGDPRHRLADLQFWVRHSPVTNVPAEGLPSLFILCRTGLNDMQVYPYEPLKWIIKSRGGLPADRAGGLPKLLGIEVDQGHFYTGGTEIEARARDLAILDSFIGSFRVRI